MVIPVIKIGQSAEWMEVLDCTPLMLVQESDSIEVRELRERLGDLVFLAYRLLSKEEQSDARYAALKERYLALEERYLALKARVGHRGPRRPWRR